MSASADDLADYLAVPPVGPDALRDAILRQTGRVLMRRRWCAAVIRFGSPVVAAIAGAAVVWQFAPRTVVVERVVTVEPALVFPLDSPAPQLSAQRLEADADQSTARREAAKRYRAAGDRYAATNDFESALRCYRQALDAGTDLTISPDDHWLLMTLKADRQKEKTDANPDS
jgi:hypothetical protein